MSDTPSLVPFLPARAKLWIGSLDKPSLEVRAQYNPKELQIDKQVTWGDHKARENRSGAARNEKSKQADLEYTGGTTRSMSIELLFDASERGERSVEKQIRDLEEMSSAIDPESNLDDRRRPHHCVVAWGDSRTGMRPFRCVIESLAVKYTMWDSNGIPLRATCTVKVKEALRMQGVAAQEQDYGVKGRDSWRDEERSGAAGAGQPAGAAAARGAGRRPPR